jgi:hypothetical protein
MRPFRWLSLVREDQRDDQHAEDRQPGVAQACADVEAVVADSGSDRLPDHADEERGRHGRAPPHRRAESPTRFRRFMRILA